MTKQEAIQEIMSISSGTWSVMLDTNHYERVDAHINRVVAITEKKSESDFEHCKNWKDVLRMVNRNMA